MRYPQFCALARAAEILGERWTLLIVRELLLGPKRFVDLRQRLDGVSPSMLTARLARAEALGLVERRALPAPAVTPVYALTAHGQALRPAVHELIRWGGRFLLPARRGERMEPEWMHLALAACARRGPTPARTFRLRVTAKRAPGATLRVSGGPDGTTVGPDADEGAADVTIVTDVPALLGLASGLLDPEEAITGGRISASGDRTALRDFPHLFEITPPMAAGRRPIAGAKETTP